MFAMHSMAGAVCILPFGDEGNKKSVDGILQLQE